MKNLFQDFVNLLYPEVCPGCGDVISSGETTLCLKCQIDLPVFHNEQIVENILGGRVAIETASIYLKFYSGGITQRLLHEVKYRNNKKLGEYLGAEHMKAGNNKNRFRNIDLIIPVPLHAKKLKQRGYNQSDLIATGISSVLGKPVDTQSVKRIEKSETQTRKSREERWINVSGIFKCNGDIKGRNILLVDDVITTGATMEACAHSVLEAEANSVSFAALATAMQ